MVVVGGGLWITGFNHLKAFIIVEKGYTSTSYKNEMMLKGDVYGIHFYWIYHQSTSISD